MGGKGMTLLHPLMYSSIVDRDLERNRARGTGGQGIVTIDSVIVVEVEPPTQVGDP